MLGRYQLNLTQFSYFSQFLLFLVAGSGGGGGVEGGRRGPQRRAVVGAAGDPTARQALAESPKLKIEKLKKRH